MSALAHVLAVLVLSAVSAPPPRLQLFTALYEVRKTPQPPSARARREASDENDIKMLPSSRRGALVIATLSVTSLPSTCVGSSERSPEPGGRNDEHGAAGRRATQQGRGYASRETCLFHDHAARTRGDQVDIALARVREQ